MIELKHAKTRRYLNEHWGEITSGIRHLSNLAAIELGEEIAEALPTKILDNFGRSRVQRPIADRLEDLIAHLESQRESQ